MTEIFDPGAYLRLLDSSTQQFLQDFPGDIPSFLLFYNQDTGEVETTAFGQRQPLQSAREFDARIDNNFTHAFADVYPTIAAAVAAGHISIFIRSAGDTSAVTIASTDLVQRIQGKDADTTRLPVTVTCNKDDVTFEQLKIADVTISGSGLRARFDSVYVTGLGSIDVANASYYACRFQADAAVANQISALGAGVILGCAFRGGLNGANPTGYTIIGSGPALQGRLILANTFLDPVGGGISVTGSLSEGLVVIAGNSFVATAQELTAGRRHLLINNTGTATTFIVSNNLFFGYSSNTVLFEAVGTSGIHLRDNAFSIGKVLLDANIVLEGNRFSAGVTVDFQSKTGIVVRGGDGTGATFSNMAADTVIQGVKGQPDRNAIYKLWDDLRPVDFQSVAGAGTAALRGSAGGVNRYYAWDFDAAVVERIGGSTITVPEDISANTTVTIELVCALAADGGSNNVVTSIDYAVLAEGDQADEAIASSAVVITSTSGKLLDEKFTVQHVLSATGWAAGQEVRLGVTRNATHASDTYASDLYLLGVKVYYYAVR